MSDVLRYLLGAPVAAIPLEVSNLVPLHRVYRPTGAVMANAGVAFIGGRLLVHPERLAEMRRALANPQPSAAEVARWADDGGATP